MDGLVNWIADTVASLLPRTAATACQPGPMGYSCSSDIYACPNYRQLKICYSGCGGYVSSHICGCC
jgi:hypothetical protein